MSVYQIQETKHHDTSCRGTMPRMILEYSNSVDLLVSQAFVQVIHRQSTTSTVMTSTASGARAPGLDAPINT